VAASNPKKIHSYEDVKKNPALKLAVVNGTSHLTFAEGVGIPEKQLVVIANNADALATIATGRADAYAAVEATVASLAEKNSKLSTANPFTDPVINGKSMRSYGGFAFQKQDSDLVAAFNKALAAFKKTPEYKKILQTYGVSEQSVNASLMKTTSKLCGGN
ncbi:MAG: transporter substrate-binding domain-containing protein, partial [Burkholderiaceae bacterium]